MNKEDFMVKDLEDDMFNLTMEYMDNSNIKRVCSFLAGLVGTVVLRHSKELLTNDEFLNSAALRNKFVGEFSDNLKQGFKEQQDDFLNALSLGAEKCKMN